MNAEAVAGLQYLRGREHMTNCFLCLYRLHGCASNNWKATVLTFYPNILYQSQHVSVFPLCLFLVFLDASRFLRCCLKPFDKGCGRWFSKCFIVTSLLKYWRLVEVCLIRLCAPHTFSCSFFLSTQVQPRLVSTFFVQYRELWGASWLTCSSSSLASFMSLYTS